jgi:peptidyl-tRNA hydrolase
MMYLEESKKSALYILIRTDMLTMTPGRAAAQSSHITSACEKDSVDFETEDVYHAWKQTTDQGFGTAIVLGGSIDEIDYAIQRASDRGFESNWVDDPTYVVPDGDVNHLVHVTVGGYIFVHDRDAFKEEGITEGLELF